MNNPLAIFFARNRVFLFIFGFIGFGFAIAFIWFMNSPMSGTNGTVRFVPESGVSLQNIGRLSGVPKASKQISRQEPDAVAFFYLKTNLPAATCRYVWQSDGQVIKEGAIVCKNGDNFISLFSGNSALITGTLHTIAVYDSDNKTLLTEIRFRVVDP